MESSVLTIAQAAADLQTTEAVIWKHHRDGRLAIMYLAGQLKSSRTGGKNGRIPVAEWERFKKDLTVSFIPKVETFPEPPRKAGQSSVRKESSEPPKNDFVARFERRERERLARQSQGKLS